MNVRTGGMQKCTVSLRDRDVDVIDDVEQRDDVDSRSEAVRRIITEYADLRAECEDLRTECERLKNEKRTILEQREENEELVAYVDQEKTLQERKAKAGVVTRLRWWVSGMDVSDDSET